jgi:hypothetical protein
VLDQGKEQPHPHLYLFVVSGGFLRQSMPNQIVCLADSLTVFQSIRCSTIAQTNGITWFIIRLAGVSGFASTGCGTSHSRASDCKVLIGFTPPSPPHPAIAEPWRMHVICWNALQCLLFLRGDVFGRNNRGALCLRCLY